MTKEQFLDITIVGLILKREVSAVHKDIPGVSWCYNCSVLSVVDQRRCLQVFTPIDRFHILLCYSLNLKWIQFRCSVTGLHTMSQNVIMELCLLTFLPSN